MLYYIMLYCIMLYYIIRNMIYTYIELYIVKHIYTHISYISSATAYEPARNLVTDSCVSRKIRIFRLTSLKRANDSSANFKASDCHTEPR